MRFQPLVCALIFALCLPADLLAARVESAPRIQHFHARLAPSPVDFRNASQITGGGELSAQLQDNRLTLQGGFRGLQAPATSASLHLGALATPGPAFAELRIEHATAGRLEGEVKLDEEQVQRLRAKGLYVQINSEAAPEGNLRGWLFPAVEQP